MQFIQNMVGRMIGPSDETIEKIRPWIIWGFVGIVCLSLLIYIVGSMFFFKDGPGFWSITGNTFKTIPNINITGKDVIEELSTSKGGSPIPSVLESESYEHSV